MLPDEISWVVAAPGAPAPEQSLSVPGRAAYPALRTEYWLKQQCTIIFQKAWKI